jgi:MYXO-CTERM domain-containing protein
MNRWSVLRTSLSVVALVVLAGGPTARAQSLMTTCMGGNAPVTTFGLAIKNSDGTFTSIGSLSSGSVVDDAECLCNSQDLYLQSSIVTVPLVPGSVLAFSVWEGAGCNASTARQGNSVTCEMITADISVLDFWEGSSNGYPRQHIDVQALISPNGASSPTMPLPHECPQTSVSNSVWFLFGDPNMSDYCAVTVPADTRPPSPARNVTAIAGEESVTVYWDVPPVGTSLPPASYVILCADAKGNPLPGQGAYDMTDIINNVHTDLHRLAYSTCIDPSTHRIQRRVLPTAAQPPPPGAGAGSTSAPLGPDSDPADGGVATDDGGVPSGTPGVGPFANLDKRFVCSDRIEAAGDHFSMRFDNLTANAAYTFSVVGVDQNGNPTPSPPVTATPQPMPMLKAGGGCSCAVAARPHLDGAALSALALLLAALVRRSR